VEKRTAADGKQFSADYRFLDDTNANPKPFTWTKDRYAALLKARPARFDIGGALSCRASLATLADAVENHDIDLPGLPSRIALVASRNGASSTEAVLFGGGNWRSG
jgi:hypothetical protein